MDNVTVNHRNNFDIKRLKAEELIDINDVEVDVTKDLEEKAEKFIEDMKNPYIHRNRGYIVEVRFSDTDYTATDALKNYLSQVAELKY